jgi:hypothetical protein
VQSRMSGMSPAGFVHARDLRRIAQQGKKNILEGRPPCRPILDRGNKWALTAQLPPFRIARNVAWFSYRFPLSEIAGSLLLPLGRRRVRVGLL